MICDAERAEPTRPLGGPDGAGPATNKNKESVNSFFLGLPGGISFTFLGQGDAVARLGRLALADAVDGADAELVGGGGLERRQHHPAGVAGHVGHFGGPADVARVGHGSAGRHDALLDDELGDGTVAVEAGDPRHVDRLGQPRRRHAARRVRQLDDVEFGVARVVAAHRRHLKKKSRSTTSHRQPMGPLSSPVLHRFGIDRRNGRSIQRWDPVRETR